jgi:invasion protein IalB
MNSSMDRPYTLCLLARSALFAASVLALGTTMVVAQEGQPVPKSSPKATPAAPAGAAPAAPPAPGPGAATDEATWVKLCMKNEQTANKQVCLVNHEGLDPNTGMVLVAAAVRSIEGEDKQHLLVRLTTANSLVMPAGVEIKIDDGEPIKLQYAVCFPTGCQVQMELTKDMFDKMRKAMAFPVPLTGFGKTFDGPPVENAKYEEARRLIMEKFRQRQIDLANKAAEAQQKKDQAGDQTVAPPDPNATVAPKKPLSGQ